MIGAPNMPWKYILKKLLQNNDILKSPACSIKKTFFFHVFNKFLYYKCIFKVGFIGLTKQDEELFVPIITIIQISNFLPATINTWALDKDFCFSYIFIFWRTCNNAKLMSFHKNTSKSSKILGDICDGAVGPMVHMNWISLTICYAVIINFEWFHGRFSWSVSVPFPRTLLDNIKKTQRKWSVGLFLSHSSASLSTSPKS